MMLEGSFAISSVGIKKRYAVFPLSKGVRSPPGMALRVLEYTPSAPRTKSAWSWVRSTDSVTDAPAVSTLSIPELRCSWIGFPFPSDDTASSLRVVWRCARWISSHECCHLDRI